MPIDFDALPARVPVPHARTATVPWLIALVVVIAGGAALSIATWPVGRPTQTLWFWTRTFGLPFLAWLLLYSGRRFVLANRRRDALADNAAIDQKEDQLHEAAGVPLIVVGQTWCFSGVPERNRLEDAMKVREQQDDKAGVGVLAVPGKPFFQGNRADEVLRHSSVLEWLLVNLVTPLAEQLRASTNPNAIAIDLCIDSVLTQERVRRSITNAWFALGLKQPEKVQILNAMSLYSIDHWLDKRTRTPLRLAIAVQLRGVISGGLQAGQAEAGAAMLLANPSRRTTIPPDVTPADAICVHRPSRGPAESISASIANALRWGRCSDRKVDTRWDTGLIESLAKAVKSLTSPVNDASVVNLAQTIGDVGVATPWLSLALAAQRAKETSDRQMILDQQDGELVAMICRKKT
jgi:hypothetical protein